MKHQGKLKTEEVDMLGRALLTTEGHIDLVTSEVNTALRRDAIKPQWMKDEVCYFRGSIELIVDT